MCTQRHTHTHTHMFVPAAEHFLRKRYRQTGHEVVVAAMKGCWCCRACQGAEGKRIEQMFICNRKTYTQPTHSHTHSHAHMRMHVYVKQMALRKIENQLFRAAAACSHS